MGLAWAVRCAGGNPSDGDVAGGAAPRNHSALEGSFSTGVGQSAGLGVLCRGRGAGGVLAGSTGLRRSFPSLSSISWLLFLPVGIPKPQGFLMSILLAHVFLAHRKEKYLSACLCRVPSASLDVCAGETRAQWCWEQG